MMALIFEQERLSRTMGRAQWREANRWRRVIKRMIDDMTEQHRDALARMTEDVVVFGTATVLVRANIIDRMIDPPVIIYPELGAL